MRENSGLNGSRVGFVRLVVLMFASFVTSSSLMGVETRRADAFWEGKAGANANAAGALSAAATMTVRNSMIVLSFDCEWSCVINLALVLVVLVVYGVG
mmetsp:Transcript_35226/g.84984  ORF Transcript_35226/g.84984 Transcript_35226/m.84984 type:complete len:98 (+) Transcript_35226:1991-2284(+)